MSEIETISWRQLTGNKYNKTLHPAMLSDQGYIRQQGIRRIGDVEKTIFNVFYDRDYVVEYLEKVVFIKLRVIDLKDLIEISLDALSNVHKDITYSEVAEAFEGIRNT